MRTITGELCAQCSHPDGNHMEGSYCTNMAHGANLNCRCSGFVSPTAEAVRRLPFGEQMILACAKYLGIDPERISEVHLISDCGGNVTGLNIAVHIPPDPVPGHWINEHLPQGWSEEVARYLKRREQKIS